MSNCAFAYRWFSNKTIDIIRKLWNASDNFAMNNFFQSNVDVEYLRALHCICVPFNCQCVAWKMFNWSQSFQFNSLINNYHLIALKCNKRKIAHDSRAQVCSIYLIKRVARDSCCAAEWTFFSLSIHLSISLLTQTNEQKLATNVMNTLIPVDEMRTAQNGTEFILDTLEVVAVSHAFNRPSDCGFIWQRAIFCWANVVAEST